MIYPRNTSGVLWDPQHHSVKNHTKYKVGKYNKNIFAGAIPSDPAAKMADPSGNATRGPVNEQSANLTPNRIRTRSQNIPKLNSINLDRLYKQAFKDSNISNKANTSKGAKPNLTTARKRKIQTTPSDGSSEPQQGCSYDADGWKMPKHPISKRHARASTSSTLPTQRNQYEALSDDETDMEQGSETENPSDNPTDATIRRPQKKRERPPPIYVTGSSMTMVINLIKDTGTPKTEFLVREIVDANDEPASKEQSKHNIYVKQIDHFVKIKNALKEKGIQFYTYTPKETKPKTLLVKGIRGAFSTDEIKQELVELGLPNVEFISVTEYQFSRDQPHKHHHLVQVTNTSTTAELFKVKSLAYQRIRWEHLRKPSLFQCRKCQRIGHASANCFLNYRCVKCAGSHEPGKCPIVAKDNRAELKCANCGKNGHPASYGGCPYLKMAMGLKKEQAANRRAATENKVNRIAASVNGNFSYAEAASSRRATAPAYLPRAAGQSTKPAPCPFPPASASYNHGSSYTPVKPLSIPPSWLADLKQELTAIIADQFKTLASQVKANSDKIDFIMGSLYNG